MMDPTKIPRKIERGRARGESEMATPATKTCSEEKATTNWSESVLYKGEKARSKELKNERGNETTHDSLQPFPQHRQERQPPKSPPPSVPVLPTVTILLPLPRSSVDLKRERSGELDSPFHSSSIQSNEGQSGEEDEDRGGEGEDSFPEDFGDRERGGEGFVELQAVGREL